MILLTCNEIEISYTALYVKQHENSQKASLTDMHV